MSSTTAEETARTRTAPDPPIHAPKHPPCTAAQHGRTAAYVSTFMQTLCCCIVLGFPCFFNVFTIPRHIGDRGRLLSIPVHRVWRWRPFFRRRPRGLLCGAGVARSRGRGGSAGALESHSKTGHSKTDSDVKILSETTTTFITVFVFYIYTTFSFGMCAT